MPLARQQALAARALRASANAILHGAARCAWPRRRPIDAKRVCIYRIGNIGDTACAIPAMHAIRRSYPSAHLTLVTSPGNAGSIGARELLDGVRWIDEIVVYHAEDIATARGRLELVRSLRARKFEVWIELPVVAAPLATLFRNLIVARSAGARWGFGWRYEPRLAAQAQTLFNDFPDEVDRLLEIVRTAGFAGEDTDFPLELTDSNRRTVTDLLDQAGVAASDPMIAFAPGAKLEPNRWPVDRFIEVGNSLASRGYRIVVLGGSFEVPMCERIVKAVGRKAVSLAGKTTVRESCEVLARCAMLVCNDSGVQHLAAAVGTPCVSLFTRREFPGMWWPHGPQHEVLLKDVECHTCFLDACPFDNKCIRAIGVDEVIAAAGRVLARHPDAKPQVA
ncbi:glycosyltransferase family 9 protein [Candidatus Binatus sp.]|uniref:glycosyltransferase family 9 protein n=1 Tax=Candidatus Binatus sp. TaxID=2811406 RepID=UPI003BAEF696